MAGSKCPKCGEFSFEAVNVKVEKSSTELTFIQCLKCGTVIGISEQNIIKEYIENSSMAIHILLNSLYSKLKT
jgi:uncharacterized Zn finger protein